MILVTVHTYNGSYGDQVQLLGVYSDLDKAEKAVYELMKYYVKQYLNFRNVFPGHIEDEDLDGEEALENLKTLFPDAYESVEIMLCPEYLDIDADCTYSIEVDDVMQDFKERIYDTGLPTSTLADYIEYDTVPKEEKKNVKNCL